MKGGRQMDTQELVKNAKKGDKEALVKLIMLQKDDYYKLAYTYLTNQHDALDAMEDMIIIVYESIYKLKKDEAFYSWSKTILVNCCKKILRQRKKLVLLETIEQPSYLDNFENNEDKILLDKYLAQLNPNHREVIQLRYLLDLEYTEIANILKVPIGTIKSRLFYGMNQLKQILGGDYNGSIR